ncbi:MAG TPA: putative DNA binding domain-containing protein, partial [Micropruina sp.]|nr:putative DNA binding domain-containing protein [Micropruina sp.]
MGADEDVDVVVARLRRVGLEPSDVEVKSAAGGLPRSIPETLSAFANGSGGTLLLGLSEDDDFRPVPGFRADAVRESLAQACHEKVVPPLRIPIEVVEFEGAQLVRADIEPLDAVDKPCFVETKGEYYGSYIRGGDGDRRLSRYEVTQLLLSRTQPTFDREIVDGATLDDLDPGLV